MASGAVTVGADGEAELDAVPREDARAWCRRVSGLGEQRPRDFDVLIGDVGLGLVSPGAGGDGGGRGGSVATHRRVHDRLAIEGEGDGQANAHFVERDRVVVEVEHDVG
jgi:hypothetical protein